MATSAIPNAGNTPPGLKPNGSAAATNASTASGSTGSAPLRARVSDDRSRSRIRPSARVASTHAKFGPAVAVPRQSEIHCIQLPGWARKSCGAACTRSTPLVIGMARNPTSPMSWYSGSHDSITSPGASPAASQTGVDVRREHPVGDHHALRLARRAARVLQDHEALGIGRRDLERVAAGHARRAGQHAAERCDRRVTRLRPCRTTPGGRRSARAWRRRGGSGPGSPR